MLIESEECFLYLLRSNTAKPDESYYHRSDGIMVEVREIIHYLITINFSFVVLI